MKNRFSHHPAPSSSHGFTILEMGVVTVVIAMIISGIIIGTDMLHVSKMHKTLVQIDSINKSVSAFRDKYKELPGDLPNATSFWGTDAACPATPFTATPHRETCNGNGNSHIGDLFTDGGTSSYEIYRAWQQLANAGFIEGNYTGVSGSGSGNHSLPFMNIPRGALEGTGYSLLFIQRPAGDASFWPARYGHSIIFGRQAQPGLNTGAALTPKEAFSLDQKIDDGHPAHGNIMAFKSTTSPNCTLNDVAATTAYRFSTTTQTCSLIFITGY